MPSVQIHPKERERLDSCSERFRPLAWKLYREINAMCATENCAPLVVYGFRSASEQLAIWAHGRELIGPGVDIMHSSSWRLTADPTDKILTRAFPGQSAHNSGDAVDIADKIASAVGQGLYGQYLGAAQEEFGTTVNQSLLNAVVGSGNAN